MTRLPKIVSAPDTTPKKPSREEVIDLTLAALPPPLRKDAEEKLRSAQPYKVKMKLFAINNPDEVDDLNEFLNREDVQIGHSNGRFFDDGSYRMVIFYKEIQGDPDPAI